MLSKTGREGAYLLFVGSRYARETGNQIVFVCREFCQRINGRVGSEGVKLLEGLRKFFPVRLAQNRAGQAGVKGRQGQVFSFSWECLPWNLCTLFL
jgi:hypothetical protein